MLIAAGLIARNPCHAATPPDDQAAAAENSLILSLTLNGERVEDSVLVIQRGTALYLPVETLRQHRILIPDDAHYIEGPGAQYVQASDLGASSIHIDTAQQNLVLQMPVAGMVKQMLDLSKSSPTALQPSVSGAYLNYDAVFQTAGSVSYAASALELGTPVLGGALSSTGLLRDGSAGTLGSGPAFIRLDTNFVREFQDDLTQLSVGDGISRAGAWSNPLRFTGIQYGTNFGIQPGYVAYPTASFSGQAALPSTVQVYVNDALRYTGDLNQGPFQLNQIPAISGGGDARVVVTDLLGRQQSVALPFYVDPTILRQGQVDFSYEAGFLRESYGLNSDRYGQFLASGTERYGLTDQHTIEAHAEATLDRWAAGTALTSVFAPIGEFQEEAAVARGPGSAGWLAGFSFSHQTNAFSIGLRETWQSANFDNGAVSYAEAGLRERQETEANLGFNLGRFGAVSLSEVIERYAREATATVSGASWTVQFGDRFVTNFYALDARQGSGGTTFGLTLTVLFGQANSGTVDSSVTHGQYSGTAQYRHAAGGDTGLDYGVLASTGAVRQFEADLTDRTTAGDFGAAVDQLAGTTSGRITASGGIAFVDDSVFFGRRINDAFAVVSVPGYAGVNVMQDNRVIGQTDQDGDLFVHTLLSNLPNHIALDTADLPVDLDVDSLQRTVTPANHGIAVIKFAAKRSDMQLIVLTQEDGKYIAPGNLVTRLSDQKEFHAGYEGEVYLEAGSDADYVADSDKGVCRFRVPEDAAGSVPTVICRGAR